MSEMMSHNPEHLLSDSRTMLQQERKLMMKEYNNLAINIPRVLHGEETASVGILRSTVDFLRSTDKGPSESVLANLERMTAIQEAIRQGIVNVGVTPEIVARFEDIEKRLGDPEGEVVAEDLADYRRYVRLVGEVRNYILKIQIPNQPEFTKEETWK